MRICRKHRLGRAHTSLRPHADSLPAMSMQTMCAAAAPAATNFIFLPTRLCIRYGCGRFGYASCRASSSCGHGHPHMMLPDAHGARGKRSGGGHAAAARRHFEAEWCSNVARLFWPRCRRPSCDCDRRERAWRTAAYLLFLLSFLLGPQGRMSANLQARSSVGAARHKIALARRACQSKRDESICASCSGA